MRIDNRSNTCSIDSFYMRRRLKNSDMSSNGTGISEHGGDWRTYELKYGRMPIDFSINVNPLGTCVAVRKAGVAAMNHVDRYPDPLCRELTEEIAQFEKLPSEYCVCGNGAADMIDRVVASVKPGRALITAPTFSGYEKALERAGCEVLFYDLSYSDGFSIQEDFLNHVKADIDIIFLCEPNNPTGVTSRPELLEEIIRGCSKKNIRLVIDESFNGFLEDPREHSMTRMLAEHHNLVILKSFTKIFAMPGLRLGYSLCADLEFNQKLRESGQSWPVSTVAQEAGKAALLQKDYIEETAALVRSEREYLAGELAKLGFDVAGGEADYILFRSDIPIFEPLCEAGILIRSCGNFRGLNDEWYRIGIRTHNDNVMLILELTGIVGSLQG